MKDKKEAVFRQDLVKITAVGRDRLEVNLVAADEMNFQVNLAGLDLNDALRDLCRVAPAMMRLDMDLMEAADDAGRTKVDPEARFEVRSFRRKYFNRVIDPLGTLQGLLE